MATTEELLLEELKKLREDAERRSKPPEPVTVKPVGGNVTGVDLADLASGKVKVDLPEVPKCVTWDPAKTLDQIAAESGKAAK